VTGDATVTLPDGTPATQIPVKPTGNDRRTVMQARPHARAFARARIVQRWPRLAVQPRPGE